MYLIKDIDEYNLVKSKKNLVAENKEIFLKLKHININYFYRTIENKNNQFKKDLYLNWFRDFNGNDLTKIGQISFGMCFSRNFIFESINLIKLKRSIDYYLNKKEKIFIFKDRSNFVRLINILVNNSSKYKKNIIFLNKKNFFYKGPNPLAKRGHIIGFKNRPITYFFIRFVQFFFSFILKNKILYFKDWSSIKFFQQSNELLTLNNKNLFKSFCLYKPFFFKEKYNTDFIEGLLKFNLDIKLIKKIFIKNNIEFNKDIFDLLNFIQKQLIKSNIKIILEYLNIYDDIINFYKPKAIIVPGGDPFHLNLLCQITKRNRCKVILSIDGYQIVKDYQGLMYEVKKKDTLFDYIFCPGKSYKKLMLDHKISNKKLIQIEPPIFLNYNFLNKYNFLEHKYDVMIIGYIPNSRNLNCFYDSNIETELEILNICQRLKFKKVAIKLKSGSRNMVGQQTTTVNLYKKLYKKKYNKILNIKLFLEYGNLYNSIHKPKMIIGPFSTSFIESLHRKIEYYVYEPEQNGFDNYELISNKICKLKYISRSRLELMKSIQSKNYFEVKKNFFIGKKINSLNKFFKKI